MFLNVYEFSITESNIYIIYNVKESGRKSLIEITNFPRGVRIGTVECRRVKIY